ncbi:alpha/beta fold hydrolase [Maritimibacter sp. UBA3975]|uniref:alpha/beta fold hydrolase n=1 Tax=Maritimibacter sp. UBA3975 TaxID=1946833 RepID=UPI000C09D065|nr:alpha/beta fold hydrolase [Maritimibacter sp. UBA3975]MAM60674.1 alpha/beta hydrolase [Maritimibacter sp.]|tara:strand:- start:3651 stop:4409 length:759 start_codon:yes stop_codon:yes gene_type:complete
MLAMQSFGADDTRPPVLIVHGLFGSGRNWGVIAKRLADSRRVVTVDMRNHGDSPRADSQSYPEMARDLAEVIGEIGGTADVIGHSMGGKAAMVLALTRPDCVNRLIVADIAPVAYGHSQMALVEAMQALDLSGIETRSDADAALAEAVAEKGVRSFLLQSLDVREGQWKLNLDVLGRDMDVVTGFPDVTGSFEGPTLFLAGAESDYVRPEHREIIKTLFPEARQAKIPGAGHWLHAEKPREFEAAARAFLDG